jgi:hypothetical protein
MECKWDDAYPKGKGIWSKEVPSVRRTKIPGGWLVYCHQGGKSGLTYYPDPNHEWD